MLPTFFRIQPGVPCPNTFWEPTEPLTNSTYKATVILDDSFNYWYWPLDTPRPMTKSFWEVISQMAISGILLAAMIV